MNYTVVWKPSAEEELTRIWMEAADRSAVTSAAGEMDRLLKTDPCHQGESRGGAMRVAFVPPLGVFFHVEEEDRLVSVVGVWRVAQGTPP